MTGLQNKSDLGASAKLMQNILLQTLIKNFLFCSPPSSSSNEEAENQYFHEKKTFTDSFQYDMKLYRVFKKNETRINVELIRLSKMLP